MIASKFQVLPHCKCSQLFTALIGTFTCIFFLIVAFLKIASSLSNKKIKTNIYILQILSVILNADVRDFCVQNISQLG